MLSMAYIQSMLLRRADRKMQKVVSTSTFRTRYVSSNDNRRDADADRWTDQSHGHRTLSARSMSDAHRRMSVTSQINGLPTFPFTPFSNDGEKTFLSNFGQKLPSGQLPRFIKPLPSKIGPEETSYLEKKGALSVPKGTLRSETLRAYIEYVHPYMPLLDLHDFLTVIDRADGSKGKVSLILFQAVMFAGSAFVDMSHLRAAGYATRKEARKDFFQKTRVSWQESDGPKALSRPAHMPACDCRTCSSLGERRADDGDRSCTTSTTNRTACHWYRRCCF